MKKITLTLNILIITLCANCYVAIAKLNLYWLIPVLFILFLFTNIFPTVSNYKNIPLRLKICDTGASLLVSFLISTVISIAYHIYIAVALFPDEWKIFSVSAITAFIIECIVFWNGIIRVYCTSVQLGIKKRILGIVCGLIPILNIIVLFNIIKTTCREVTVEVKKIQTNILRRDDYICRTKYPLLLVHGVFFRDKTFPNYWGRIPNELIRNGATVFYGEHDSAAKVSESGTELANKIKKIVIETGCERVNIIAHSKGGLDSRYAISLAGAEEYVASLTTINTPHHGCLFADYLLHKISPKIQNKIANAYNSVMRSFGDENPDFMGAVRDLTDERCKELNKEMPNKPEIYYKSVGSKLVRATAGKFPMNFTYHIAGFFSGDNDGLVSVDSCKWGDDFILLTPTGKRGISHGDLIDLNRENIEGFDVREFYVKLVSELKDRGL